MRMAALDPSILRPAPCMQMKEISKLEKDRADLAKLLDTERKRVASNAKLATETESKIQSLVSASAAAAAALKDAEGKLDAARKQVAALEKTAAAKAEDVKKAQADIKASQVGAMCVWGGGAGARTAALGVRMAHTCKTLFLWRVVLPYPTGRTLSHWHAGSEASGMSAVGCLRTCGTCGVCCVGRPRDASMHAAATRGVRGVGHQQCGAGAALSRPASEGALSRLPCRLPRSSCCHPHSLSSIPPSLHPPPPTHACTHACLVRLQAKLLELSSESERAKESISLGERNLSLVAGQLAGQRQLLNPLNHPKVKGLLSRS